MDSYSTAVDFLAAHGKTPQEDWKTKWENLDLDKWNPGLAVVAMDTAIELGLDRTKRWLEMAGNFTPEVAIETFLHLREQHYRGDPDFKFEGRSWLTKLSELRREATKHLED